MMQINGIPQFDSTKDRVRWVAYFDLLGMRDRIREGDHFGVFDAYQQVLEHLDGRGTSHARVGFTWFSDTFVLTTVDDSGQSFTEIEQVSRLFMYFMLRAHQPLRGAIAHGRMYADHEARILIGQAMVEAHDYGEGQDWIGLLLCPSAEAAMVGFGLSVAERLDYAYWRPVWKGGKGPKDAPERIGACLLGRVLDGRSNLGLLDGLRGMAASCSAVARPKYVRAIQFVLDNQRVTVRRSDAESGSN
jgi:hypothetical protein